MNTDTTKPVLIIGGSGVVGFRAARTLRRFHPDLPLAIAGRDLEKAERKARELGNAHAVKVNLERPDLGLPDGNSYSAVVMFLKDDTLNGMKYAQATGAGYIGISSGLFEIGPDVAQYIHQPASTPILLASHWLAGTATLPILHFVKDFQSVDVIDIGVLLDDQDMGGPAAYADYERMTTAVPGVMVLQEGQFVWLKPGETSRPFTSVDGTRMAAQAYSPFDVISLASATDAKSIRLDLALGETSSRRQGKPFSTEIIVEIEGIRKDGSTGRHRYEIVHPEGQAALTALGVTLGVEGLLGLVNGQVAKPGLYFPEVLIESSHMMRRLEEIGTVIRRK